MAITNYGELKTAIANWLDRTDLTNKIPDFITLAEDMIFRDLRCPGNEQMVVYAPAAGSVADPNASPPTFINNRFIVIPGDYLECRLLMYNNRPLERISDQRFAVLNTSAAQGGGAIGMPTHFARLKDKLWFFPPADNNAAVNLWYYESQGPLVNDADFTRTLRFAPGLYLYGALMQAQAYLIGDERIAVWAAQYQEIMANVNEQGESADLAGSTTTVRNIYT